MPSRVAWQLPLVTLLLAAGVSACSTAERRSTEKRLADVLVPREQEQQLGLQVKQELEQEQKIEYVTDPQVNAYVMGITDKVLAAAKTDRSDVTWTVRVINDPKTVNAFATPGGYLYVYSGLILAADNSAELAGVLGHEAGHVVARHSARQMVDAFGLETLASVAAGKNPGAASQLAAAVAGKGAMLGFSRADETEADEYGARYSSAAGYDPHGIATFFEKLVKSEGKQPGWAAMLSDHPATPERIQHVKQYIAEQHLTGKGGSSQTEIAAAKAHLKTIPPPKENPQTQQAAQPQSTGAAESK
jgi:beta-barrel assembly-enhancing protease